MKEKTIFKDNSGNMHVGVNAPAGFFAAAKEDIFAALSALADKKLWRCTVCNDLHLGMEPPKECPTCLFTDAYVQIELKEFKQLIAMLNE